MKKYRRTIPMLALLMLLNGCTAQAQTMPSEMQETTAATSAPADTEPTQERKDTPTEETIPARESVQETEPASGTEPTDPGCTASERNGEGRTPAETQTATQPQETAPPETQPPATEPAQTEPPVTEPVETTPPATEPPETEPPAEETEEATEPTEPEVTEITYEFKRKVASYAAMYLNQYRGTPCTVLSGMSQVAQYRASQLTYNFAHSTADKRAALAYYEYGRWIDATLAGLDESDSYYESDTSEAICKGFHGDDAASLGKAIADMVRGSSSHWCYVGSSGYSYMGIGVEFRNNTWYACVMVGTVNYG